MRFHRMTTTKDNAWEQSWKIYQSNFPSGEQRLLMDQKRALVDDRYHCMAILDHDEVVGIVFYWVLPSVLFVEYLAIGEAFKGRGIGSAVLSMLKQQPGRLILEIDPPIDETSIRRMNFYKRDGWVLNPYLHMNLPLRVGDEEVPLRVMTVDTILSEVEYDAFLSLLMTDIIQYGEGCPRP